jgi:beta-lactamase class A
MTGLLSKNISVLEQRLAAILNQCSGNASLAVQYGQAEIHVNSGRKYPAASLIKIPIMMEVFLQHEEGAIDLGELVHIGVADKAGGAGIIQALSEGVSLSLLDLIVLMIIVSDNTAANKLIKILGMKRINDRIQSMGLPSTVLNREMMDFNALNEGIENFTTAADMVNCLKLIKEGGLFPKKNCSRMLDIMEAQQFREKLPALADHQRLKIANKTGELPGIEHDCAIFTAGSDALYAAVLMDGLSCREEGKHLIRLIGGRLSDFLCLPGKERS